MDKNNQDKKQVITRFAPSPTGFLHIGGARTAIFNFLFARHFGGKFLLRIEDTDRERSTDEAIDAILKGMEWLGLDYDGEVVYQSKQIDRHIAVANKLLTSGNAYKCYCTKDELDQMREKAMQEKRSPRYERVCRDKSDQDQENKEGRPFVVRFKAPLDGETTINDNVQGSVTVKNDQLDDFILLRADGTPTYMLSVVIDDHDMGVTHIIRGDDHLTNTFKQVQIYKALGWKIPEFSHVPLIHGPDGKKLSKRHGALGVMEYQKMGYLSETLSNYLLRLGWSHGDDEVISREQATAWFDGNNLGKSASRMDFDKMKNLNGIYIRNAEDKRLLDEVVPFVSRLIDKELTDEQKQKILRGMDGIKQRAKTIIELSELSLVYIKDLPNINDMDDKVKKHLQQENIEILKKALEHIQNISDSDWNRDNIEVVVRNLAEDIDLKFGKVAQPLRCAITGLPVSPGVFEVMEVLGKQESINRLNKVISS